MWLWSVGGGWWVVRCRLGGISTVAEHGGGTRGARAGGGSGTEQKQSTGKRSTHYHHTNNGVSNYNQGSLELVFPITKRGHKCRLDHRTTLALNPLNLIETRHMQLAMPGCHVGKGGGNSPWLADYPSSSSLRETQTTSGAPTTPAAEFYPG